MTITLTEEEVIEGNRLIAEFVGLKEGWWMPYEKKEKTFCKLGTTPIYYASQLKYHTSWDWQMPVWRKYYSQALQEFHGNNKLMEQFDIWENNYHSAINVDSPADGFSILVLAVKWYNENKVKA